MVSGESVEKVTWLINTHSAKGDSNRSLFITSFQCVPSVQLSTHCPPMEVHSHYHGGGLKHIVANYK